MQAMYTQMRARSLPSRLDDCGPQAVLGNVSCKLFVYSILDSLMQYNATESLAQIALQAGSNSA
jgi:hypothetical protein